ncbi:3'(2'),5'-bisphosphate nucleotidase CysQ [Iodidimonas gelatinilytica]|uniref:3'(2'),5'-bisphosphate nucleotidase CysQ n=1 Tax=Iodidimonas gelatinilytica TaxID=1236966 RepID=A0A5A7MQL4_9PROT|nr:3'(2'),5'-bisphosphate nucleotidase CysQ [Iodidimonas gelatinilytica]GEQ97914.1 3'(2'),5'-bisphosphate nucleotidase CysQ [Iodidimonas gelatinilytica]
MQKTALTNPLIDVCIKAGHEIMAVARAGITVRTKDDKSPVTLADERAERVILAVLKELTPDVMIVAEEQAAAGGLPDQVDGPFWLVDPLDGTKEFLKGGQDFTVNIALIENGAPTFGIVYCPANGRLFVGEQDKGAWQAVISGDDRITEKRAISTRPCPSQPKIVASKSHRNAETDAYLAKYPDAELVSIGSSLKFCLVATGEADIYPRLGPTMEWDTAAGHAVLLAAGGRMVDEQGADFGYYKPGFKNGFFLAWGDKNTRPEAL